MTCREHATQLRGRYSEITERGAEVVAVGTGDARYARAWIDAHQVPFPVLLDDDGRAARLAGTGQMAVGDLLRPGAWNAGTRAWLHGHRQQRTGKRPLQLGATFVVGPGDRLRYAHRDRFAGDHAPPDQVLAALP
ncbi:MAG: AhpC/TSA family protein [Acidimicrobiia bacterium]